ncbi:MAG: periplasmic heavy metal sensor [Cyclobacteriaceae bacterium]|nr:periplasmic heavy metal sensor [Cyclobacteriaceae bacterium]
MKQLTKISALLILLGGFATTLWAQPAGDGPQKRMKQNSQVEKPIMKIPDLTDAQKEKIEDIQLNTMKQVQPMKNQLMEKKAHLRTLTTAEKVNMSAINSQIDEIAQLEASIQKLQAASHQGVRNLLTDEQRIVFDAQSGRRMGGHGPGFGPGEGKGQGHGSGKCGNGPSNK